MASTAPNVIPITVAKSEAFHVAHLLGHRSGKQKVNYKRSGRVAYLLYIRICPQLTSASAQNTCGWIWIGMLKF